SLAAMIAVYLTLKAPSLELFYWMTGLLGLASGYWALFVTVASEQFGTNIRSTVTTTVPNFVRGSVIPITFLFQLLNPSVGVLMSAAWVGAATLIVAAISLRGLEETYHKDLDYIEVH
ncbi:MAG: MFS transporter, partial [Bdellovibrionota bacterium]